MTPRYTKKDAEKAFDRICRLLGKEIGHYVTCTPDGDVPAGSVVLDSGRYRTQPGAWALDYAACYGGYQITEILEDSTGVTCPLGMERRSAREVWQLAHDLQELAYRGLIRTGQEVTQ